MAENSTRHSAILVTGLNFQHCDDQMWIAFEAYCPMHAIPGKCSPAAQLDAWFCSHIFSLRLFLMPLFLMPVLATEFVFRRFGNNSCKYAYIGDQITVLAQCICMCVYECVMRACKLCSIHLYWSRRKRAAKKIEKKEKLIKVMFRIGMIYGENTASERKSTKENYMILMRLAKRVRINRHWRGEPNARQHRRKSAQLVFRKRRRKIDGNGRERMCSCVCVRVWMGIHNSGRWFVSNTAREFKIKIQRRKWQMA